MAFKNTSKCTAANLRRRIRAIEDAADSLSVMAKNWNPKGRHFTLARDLRSFSTATAEHAHSFLMRMETMRRA